MELATNLSGDARSVLIELGSNITWETLVEKLEGRYEPKDQKPVHQAILRCRKRKTGENLPELMADIKRLIRRAYPTADAAISDELTVKHFKDALNNEAMEWAVHETRDTSTDAALAAAMNYEAFHAGRVKIKETEKATVQDWKVIIPEIRKMLEDRREEDSMQDDRDRWRGGGRRNFDPNRDKDVSTWIQSARCYRCDEVGHLARDCSHRRRLEEDERDKNIDGDEEDPSSPKQGNGSSLGN